MGSESHLRSENYGNGIEHAIREIDMIVNENKHVKRRSQPASSGDSSEFLFFVGIVVVFGAIIMISEYRNRRQEASMNRGREALNRLMQDVRSMEDHRFPSATCPICLEPFAKVDNNQTNTSPDIETKTDVNDNLSPPGE